MADYKGVSVLVEYIKRDGDRVDISRLGPEELDAPNVEGGYLFKKDKGLDANTTFATATENQTLGFVYPSQPAGVQINYIKGYLDNMEQFLHGDNFADPTAGYAQYMDVGSFIDVHLLVEMCKQIDGYRLSSYFHKDRGGKLVSGPVWDYNLSLGNADYNGGDNPEGWYADLVGANGYPWYQRLFADPEFVLPTGTVGLNCAAEVLPTKTFSTSLTLRLIDLPNHKLEIFRLGKFLARGSGRTQPVGKFVILTRKKSIT